MALLRKATEKIPSLLAGTLRYSRASLLTTWRYVRVEFKPPTPNEIPEVSQRLNHVINSVKTGQWKNVTVKQAWLNTLVALELGLIFFIGEVVGRGTLIGYDVSRVKILSPFLW